MVLLIARKEFLVFLLSRRMLAASVACALLMGLSAWVLAADYTKRLDGYKTDLLKAEKELDQDQVYAELEVYLVRPPSPLSIFSEGLEKRLGNILRFSYAQVPTLSTWSKETNPLLDAFPPFDLATVAQLLFSLMALFTAFDMISGEREGGTLLLMGSNPVTRYQVLAGKWLGGMFCLGLSALIGFLVAMLVVSLAGPHPEFAAWVRAALLFGVCLLFMGAYFSLGLFISTRVSQSVTALIIAISLWMLTVVVGPTTVAYVVGEAVDLPAERENTRRQKELEEEFKVSFQKDIDDLLARTEHSLGVMSTYTQAPLAIIVTVKLPFEESARPLADFHAKTEPRRIEYSERIADVQEELIRDRVAQADYAAWLTRPFLAPAFRQAATDLAGTGLHSYLEFIRYAQAHRNRLINHMRQEQLFRSSFFYSTVAEEDMLPAEETLRRWKRKELTVAPSADWNRIDRQLPRISGYKAELFDNLAAAVPDLVLLLAANLLFGLLALRSFVRRPLA